MWTWCSFTIISVIMIQNYQQLVNLSLYLLPALFFAFLKSCILRFSYVHCVEWNISIFMNGTV